MSDEAARRARQAQFMQSVAFTSQAFMPTAAAATAAAATPLQPAQPASHLPRHTSPHTRDVSLESSRASSSSLDFSSLVARAVKSEEIELGVDGGHEGPDNDLDTSASASRPHTPTGDDFDPSLVPRSPPYFADFTPSLRFLGGSITQQYERFFQMWSAFQARHGKPVDGHDEKRVGTIYINAFEAFRAVVQRGGYFRCFVLVPVQGEVPPMDQRTGLPQYAVSNPELAYEIGNEWPSGEPGGQLPTSTRLVDWSTRVYQLRDGRFLRNLQFLRSFKIYYERYLLAFENAHLWRRGAIQPIFQPNAKADGLCLYDFSQCRLEFREPPEQFRPDRHEMKRLYKHLKTLTFTATGATATEDAPPTATAATLPHAPLSSSLHRSGTYALMRTFQACFLSNPVRVPPLLLAELVSSVNQLLALSKLYAIRCSLAEGRTHVDQKLRTLLHAATNTDGEPSDATHHDRSVGAAVSTSSSLVSLLPAAPPSWYFDVLLLFEYDLITRLLEQPLHPRNMQRRIDNMMATLGAHGDDDDDESDDHDGMWQPLLAGLPSAFFSRPRLHLLPPSAHRFFIRQLLHHLNDISYPNLTLSVLTILQNLSYPGSVVQKLVESQTTGESSHVATAKHKKADAAPTDAATDVTADADASLFVSTVRSNLLRHPTLVSMLLDFADADPNSHALDLRVDNTKEEPEPNRFDIIDIPPRDVKAELEEYIDLHSKVTSTQATSQPDSQSMIDAPISILPTHDTTIKTEQESTFTLHHTGVVKMEIDGEDGGVEEEKKMPPPLLSSTSSASSATAATARTSTPTSFGFIPIARSFPADECRAVALQTLLNLAVDLPWLADTSIFDATVPAPLDGPSTTPTPSRVGIFWREMCRELDDYYTHIARQAAVASFARGSLSSPPESPPGARLEFIMSSFQLLLQMLQSSSSRSVLEQLLPRAHEPNSSAAGVMRPAHDFYHTLIGIATLDLEEHGVVPRSDAAHATDKLGAKDGNGKLSQPPMSPLHWSLRVQLAALEVLIQCFLVSRVLGAYFLRTTPLVASLVRVMRDAAGKRLRRTAAAAIAAVLQHAYQWDRRRAKRTRTDAAQLPSSTNSTPLVLAMMQPHQAVIFQACVHDADVSHLLSKWLQHASRLDEEATAAAKTRPHLEHDTTKTVHAA